MTPPDRDREHRAREFVTSDDFTNILARGEARIRYRLDTQDFVQHANTIHFVRNEKLIELCFLDDEIVGEVFSHGVMIGRARVTMIHTLAHRPLPPDEILASKLIAIRWVFDQLEETCF